MAEKRLAIPEMMPFDEAGAIVEEIRILDSNTDDLAQRYAGADAAIEATSNYYHIHDTLSEQLDITIARPSKLTLIANTDKKTDHVDIKEVTRMVRLDSVPESYVPTDKNDGSHRYSNASDP